MELTKKLGQIRLQYQFTDKAYLLPPNMRTIARFMNMSSWVTWGNLMLACLESLLTKTMNINISSDIIKSTFGIYKGKKSPNKLYGVTPFALMIPLYPKVATKVVTKTFKFKERIMNVKLKDIDTWYRAFVQKLGDRTNQNT